MIRRCAWCGADMGTTPDDQHPEDAVTHGICDDCEERELARLDGVEKDNADD